MGASEEYIEIPEVPTNPDFDPTRQFFWILLQDGKTLVETSVFDIDELRMVSVYQAASFAAQVGAASVLLAAIFLMTKSEKRRSSVFCLNALSLALVIIRGILSLESLTGPFYEFWSWKTHTYINVGDAEIISALSGVAGLLLTIAILLASFVQVRIVCCTLSDTRRYLINISNAIVISAAVAMRFALTVISIKWNTLDASNMDITRFNTMNKLGSAANITLVITIAFSTVIFTAKLASAIIARRSMGMKQFGPMQIIFVMGCQTMFTPRRLPPTHTLAQPQLTFWQSSSQSSPTPASRTPTSRASSPPSSPSRSLCRACGPP